MQQRTRDEWASEVFDLCDQLAREASDLTKAAVALTGLRGQVRTVGQSLRRLRPTGAGEGLLTPERSLLEQNRQDLAIKLREAETALGRAEGRLSRSCALAVSLVDELSAQMEAYESEAEHLGEHQSERFGNALARAGETRSRGANFLRELIAQIQGALRHGDAARDDAQRIGRSGRPTEHKRPVFLPMPPTINPALPPVSLPRLPPRAPMIDRFRAPSSPESLAQQFPIIGLGGSQTYGPIGSYGSPGLDASAQSSAAFSAQVGQRTGPYDGTMWAESTSGQIPNMGLAPGGLDTSPIGTSLPEAMPYGGSLDESTGFYGGLTSPTSAVPELAALMGTPMSPIGLEQSPVPWTASFPAYAPSYGELTFEMPSANYDLPSLPGSPQASMDASVSPGMLNPGFEPAGYTSPTPPTLQHDLVAQPTDLYAVPSLHGTFSPTAPGAPLSTGGFDPGPINPIQPFFQSDGYGGASAFYGTFAGGGDIHDYFGVTPGGDITGGVTTVHLPGGADAQLPW